MRSRSLVRSSVPFKDLSYNRNAFTTRNNMIRRLNALYAGPFRGCLSSCNQSSRNAVRFSGSSNCRSLYSTPIRRSPPTEYSDAPQPSVWTSLVPKAWRNRDKNAPKKPRSKEWNPATFYIVIFLLIGSNAINMIKLKNEFELFSRRADAKIGLLKEVIQRVQNGEDVDVEGLLGTGDKAKEKEWEESEFCSL
jgi:Family of unknown function (DUF5321)